MPDAADNRQGKAYVVTFARGYSMRNALKRALATALTLIAVSSTAHAVQDRSFVRADGGAGFNCSDHLNACTTFTSALTNTNPGGVIYCLNSVLDGAISITKSITIDCTNTNSSVVAVGANAAITINGAGIVVTLRGLKIRGQGGSFGVNVINAAAVIIEDSSISNFNVAPAVGIKFAPSAGAQLVVTDTSITGNGSGAAGGGIVINPAAGGFAQVTLNRVSVAKNVFGIVADGTGSSTGINMTIADSVSSSNGQDGVIAVTPGGGAPIGVYVKNTKSAYNATGIRSIGPGVTVRVDGSSVIGNSTGLSFSGGGALLSAGNNMIQANGANGAFSGTVGLQ
jgi:hypothetical protein